MLGAAYKKDVKKRILIILDVIFGVYFLNLYFSFLGTIEFGETVSSILLLLSGILLILNFLYLLIFSRRVI